MSEENKKVSELPAEALQADGEHDKRQAEFLLVVLEGAQLHVDGATIEQIATQVATAKGWLKKFIDRFERE